MEREITLPLTEELAKTLHAGDFVSLTGTIYTSRDAGHRRMCEALAKGEKLPFDPTDATIYYVGPTTSGRMDAYAPALVSVGARGMIGKGALLAKCIKKNEPIAYEDLGAEALCKLYVEKMPLVVIIDSFGKNLYEEGRRAYLERE